MPLAQGKMFAVVVSVAAGLLSPLTASAQATAAQPFQTLDRVNVYNKTNVLEMEFDNPARTFDFATLGVAPATATGFKACQVTASQALYCIDGAEVRYWAKPLESSGVGTRLFGCGDVGFDAASTDACIGITVDLSGSIWLSGRRGAGYALVKAVPTSANNCPGGQTKAGSYCAVTFATSAIRFLELSAIDGDAGVAFKGPGTVGGPGILALEATAGPSALTNNTLLFFPTPAGSSSSVPVPIAAGSAVWAGLPLQPGEAMQSATLLQLPPLASGGGIRNFALVATTRGRILATDTVSPAAFQVFDIVASRRGTPQALAPVQCKQFTPQQYGIRASSKSGRVYLSDRLFCQSVALQSNGLNPFSLVNVQEDGANLTFSTTAAYPPDATTLAPGVIVNLLTCGTMCVLLYDALGNPAAWLSDVQLQSTQAGMTLYQVKNLPDCRWKPQHCTALGFPASNSSLVYNSSGVGVSLQDVLDGRSPPPNQLFLNVTPLLPREITDQFTANQPPPKGLPVMLISPQYRAQELNDFKFEALFGIPEAGVVFKQTFNGEFDVCRLTGGVTEYNLDGSWKGCALPGRELGCGYDYSEAAKPNRKFDVTTVVSERFVSAVPGAMIVNTAPVKYVDTMANTGCYNPTQISGDRWSIYNYNLEVAPNTDAVFGRLVVSLYDDLEETRARLACTAYDTGGRNAPLSNTVCSSLRRAWAEGKPKLDTCFSAAIKPKSSAGSENCQAFLSQFRQFRDALNAAPIPPAAQDPANRIGELKKRSLVILHVFNQRFLPSIPAEGFTNQ